MLPKTNDIISNAKILADKQNELRILKNCISANLENGGLSFLYGYTIANLDLKIH